ncbi:protein STRICTOSIDINE SYNTHASE-LIKE 5-like isoform X2 [Durio zibethinus]|uniref:Protein STRICTOSIDINE SYNTHASE-LIKE 5-like isoform X2 n=1 Tax=Durio zibethinus TaxID=66656 RepID=A0A6P6BEH1_DURZI|nr:protein STRICTOSIDINE SYNTHASE-LIKE 5-like isoform X2 [Durio zibethinus]
MTILTFSISIKDTKNLSRTSNAAMPDSSSETVMQYQASNSANQPRKRLWPFTLVLSTMVPVLAAVLVYQLDSFEPAPMPIHELGQTPMTVSLRNDRMLQGAEFVGAGKLQGPEDIAYDPKSQLIYTGCQDGWIKRVRLNDSAVENLVNTHGRPLGLALGHNDEVIVADAYKGLLNISRDGEVELLTDEADGLKFKITDGVDIADNGMIYFTDASYKYDLHDHLWEILDGKPHGRFMSFDPVTRKTRVLVGDLYFANGVAVSPRQDSAIFCETIMRRCRNYHIQANKQGRLEKFLDNLPGYPDNIRYDGDGHYWIGLAAETSVTFELAFRYPFIRKAMAIMAKYIARLPNGKNAGILAVDLEGKPVAHYHDRELSAVTGGMKIGNLLYCGSLTSPHIISLNLDKHPAKAAA